jgi:hypothetical protein
MPRHITAGHVLMLLGAFALSWFIGVAAGFDLFGRARGWLRRRRAEGVHVQLHGRPEPLELVTERRRRAS